MVCFYTGPTIWIGCFRGFWTNLNLCETNIHLHLQNDWIVLFWGNNTVKRQHFQAISLYNWPFQTHCGVTSQWRTRSPWRTQPMGHGKKEKENEIRKLDRSNTTQFNCENESHQHISLIFYNLFSFAIDAPNFRKWHVPTDGVQRKPSTLTLSRCFLGPTPDSCRMYGEPTAPAEMITSLRALTCSLRP